MFQPTPDEYQDEIRYRRELWESLLMLTEDPARASTAEVRASGIYSGYRGIYPAPAGPRGLSTAAALCLASTGKHYDDELTPEGMVYQFSGPTSTGKDHSDVESLRIAHRLALPVFYKVPSVHGRNRVRIGRGIIESINEDERSVLVSFIDDSIPDPPLTGEPLRDESVMREDIRRRLQSVIARPHQLRFANAVFARYGRRCAVCPLTQRELLDAAHIRAKSDRGSDSPGNGLPLCANHHRAFDRGLWAIRPEDHRLVAAAGTELGRLGIAEHSLLHGRPQPVPAAIAAQWAAFSRAQRG